MRKYFYLICIGFLLVSMVGCGSHNTINTSVPKTRHHNQQSNNSTVEKYQHSKLVLPNGEEVTSDDQQPLCWKGLKIQLYTQVGDRKENSIELVNDMIGNHTDVITQKDLKSVPLSSGPAMLVPVKRTEPAASGSDTVTNERWLIAVRPDPDHKDRQFIYAIEAVLVDSSLQDASEELIKISKGWELPAFPQK